VARLCRVLDVSVSAYYAWRKRQPSRRRQEDEQLSETIQRVHTESHQRYGSPRVHAELQAQGIRCGRKRVARLMRQTGLRGKCKWRQRVCTTDSKHKLPVAENVLKQDFTAEQPNAKWVADITYIPTDEGWLYLAAVVDIFSRKVVGWAMDATMTSELVERALDAALVTRRPLPGLLHHSDRGSQYASHDYQARLQAAQVQVSMSRTGNCYDNALMESFWATLKTELVEDQVYASHLTARHDILLYIEGFYNLRRRHSALGYLSPTEFERRHLITFSVPEAIGT
jgi:putative transposase